MIYLSIVIPSFKSEKTLPRLIQSIKREMKRPACRQAGLEIIVEDGKRGPARARNMGAKKAKGEVLLFLDSDVVVQPGTIKEVVRTFKEDKYRVAATGVWEKSQESQKFFPKFKALRDWSYWINERKADSYYYLFSTRIAAIRKDVFLKLDGFNESFSGADVEDIEFTYRLARKYRVDFNQNMRVKHEFEDFWPIAKKYFKRAYQWVEIFQNRKKFDPVATTGSEAITTLSAIGLLSSFMVLLLLMVIQKIYNLQFTIYNEFSIFIFTIFFLFLTIHLWGVHKFLFFVHKEEGFLFAVKSFFVGLVLYLFIFSGAVLGVVRAKLLSK